MVGQVGKGMLSEIVCKKFHSSLFRFARTSWIIFVRNNPLVRPSATKIWINCTAQYWCFTPYKPYIFWKLVTPTFHWPTVHSPIAHSDPPHPHNPATWLFIHLMMFNTIQTEYFMKPHVTHYLLTHCRLTLHPHRLTEGGDALQISMYWWWWCIAGVDSLQVVMHLGSDALRLVMHGRCWCTESGDALQMAMHCRWWCTQGGDALKVVMHSMWWGIAGGYELKVVMHRRYWCTAGSDVQQVVMHCRWWCTAGSDSLEVVRHFRWWCTVGGDVMKMMMHCRLWCT